MSQRVNIKSCFQTSKTATETSQLIKQAYGNNLVSCTRVCEWYARFRDGCENLEDDELSEKLRAWHDRKFLELILADRQMTLGVMEEELEISRETIRKILVEDLL
jgi:hypothetical protein